MTREELEKEYWKIKNQADELCTAYRPFVKKQANEELRNELAIYISGISMIISLYVIFFK